MKNDFIRQRAKSEDLSPHKHQQLLPEEDFFTSCHNSCPCSSCRMPLRETLLSSPPSKNNSNGPKTAVDPDETGGSGQSFFEVPDLTPFILGGVASCVAEASTFPIDTAKTRLQLQGQTIDARFLHQKPYRGRKIHINEVHYTKKWANNKTRLNGGWMHAWSK